MGVMGYVSSPLWLLFMLLSTIHVFAVVTSPASAEPVVPERVVKVLGRAVEVGIGAITIESLQELDRLLAMLAAGEGTSPGSRRW